MIPAELHFLEAGAALGFAIWCDPEGVFTRLAYDSLGLSGALVHGQPISMLIDPHSRHKLFDFLLAVRQQGAAFDWELNVRLNGAVQTLHFAGILSGEELLISGARTRVNLWHFFDEMLGIANDQANLARTFAKELVAPPAFPPASLSGSLGGALSGSPATSPAASPATSPPRDLGEDGALYNEISHLNNELVNLQRELARKTAELQRLNAEKNQFLGIAAHDLRSPLTAIIAYTEFVLESAAARLDEAEVEYLLLVGAQGEFMRSIVDDLLDLSAIEAGKLHLELYWADLADLVTRTVAVFRPLAAQKRIALLAVIDGAGAEPLPQPFIDRAKIEQVLHNLISNAIKYSHPHTQVSVIIRHVEGTLQVSVEDQGQGIPAGELAHLFQPFATTSVKATGGEKSIGLGLLIAKKVIDAHHGRIWVESCEGRGSSFTFALPVGLGHPPLPRV